MMQSAFVRYLPTERKVRGLKGFPGRGSRAQKTAEPELKRPSGRQYASGCSRHRAKERGA
ncbi:hypothetical protein MASR1M66_03810 [Aminivibrio sp.]